MLELRMKEDVVLLMDREFVIEAYQTLGEALFDLEVEQGMTEEVDFVDRTIDVCDSCYQADNPEEMYDHKGKALLCEECAYDFGKEVK